jgi:ribosomal protein L3
MVKVIFSEEGLAIPVTVIEVEPLVIVAKKTVEKEGYNAIVVSCGEIKEKISIYHLIESLKTWSFVDGKLSFIDNNYIQNVTENGTLFSYMVYIIEYIKLIRNIINPKVAQQLIDSDGNISKYTSSNEIVQCRVSQSNFTLRIGSEGIKE